MIDGETDRHTVYIQAEIGRTWGEELEMNHIYISERGRKSRETERFTISFKREKEGTTWSAKIIRRNRIG